MFYEYQLRIHSLRRDDDIVEWLRSRADAWYCAYESDANRNHYQMYIKSKYKEQSLRRYIKEELKLEGNRQYSLSLLRKEVKDLVCYLMKEGVLVSKNIQADIVALAEAQAKEIAEASARPKDRFKTTVQQIMDTITIQNPTDAQIRVFVYNFYWKRKRLIPDGVQVNKYVRTISAYMKGGQAIVDMIREDLWASPHTLQDVETVELMNQLFLFETE